MHNAPEDLLRLDRTIGSKGIVTACDDLHHTIALPDPYDPMRGQTSGRRRQNDVAAPQFRRSAANDVKVVPAADRGIHAVA